MPRSFTRTPLACGSCRRRKTKCDGVRPRCKHCLTKDLQCVWSMPDHQDDGPSIEPVALTPESTGRVLVLPSQVDEPSVVGHSTEKGLQICLDLFFSRHFASDFCSFDHRPDFERKCRHDATLSAALVALCGRYLDPHEAQNEFGLPTSDEVFRLHMQRARHLVKMVSDEPSVAHVQANLILALAEFISSSGSRHWLFTGMAIRMAEIMRLNKEFHQKHSFKEQEIRRRIFWACLLFDKALAYFLAKHRTVNDDNVSISVPGTDIAMLYQEQSRGVLLDSLSTYEHPSDLGLSAYFIKTVSLWSDLADFAGYSRRRLEPRPPTHPQSSFFIRTDAVRVWTKSLPQNFSWSARNYGDQCALGQRRMFLSLQFLLHGSYCIAHQCYLPHHTLYTNLVDLVDAAGWSYLHREESLIGECVSSALMTGEMLDYLMDPEQGNDQPALQTIWVAATTLTAANVFLWIQYAHDETYSTPEYQQRAKHYFHLIHELVSTWTRDWKVASRWFTALEVMHDLYEAAYLGDVHERFLINTDGTADHAEDELTNDFRPQPGDGYPTRINLPNLQASVKFATCDTSARSIDVPSIWLQLSGGWPFGYVGPRGSVELMMEDNLEIQPDLT